MKRLEALRRRIRGIDSALLALVAERMELAREVGEEKRAAGIPLRDYEVERRVLDRAAATAEELGLAPEAAHALMRQLIEEACRLQEVGSYRAYRGEAETIALVGGAGRMGRWLQRFLLDQGQRVAVVDPALAAEQGGTPLPAALGGSTIVLLATPLAATGEALDTVVAAGYRGVVCDIASVKGHLRPAIARAAAAGVAVTSIHPMFGPDVRTLSDRVIVVCDCGHRTATERVTALFRDTAVTLVPLSLERHDEIAGYVLGLSHFVNLAFARVLASSGVPCSALEGVGSTTFRSQLVTTRSVVGEDAELYFAIQAANPNSSRIWEALERAAADLSGWVAGGDLARFAQSMSSSRDWLEAERSGGDGSD